VSEGNRLLFNLIQEGEDHEAGHLKAQQISRVLETVRPRARVADLGCHNGVYTSVYARVPGVEMIEGFDVADQAIEAARARGIAAFIWNAGLEPCSADTERYDVLIAGDVIEHIVDTEFFVEEMRRIVRQNGYVILTTPNLYYWVNRLKFLFARAPWNYPGVSCQFKVDRNINTEHIRVNGITEWSAFFTARGFKVVRAEGLAWVPPTTLKRRIIRLIDKLVPKEASCLMLFLLRKE
jgi:SAM-dependent methyltransferase